MNDARTVGAADMVIGPALERLEEIRGRFGITAIEPYLEACEDLLRESRFIDVGIFGRFKAGKSSLLNHLARRAVLPVGVTPVTAIITIEHLLSRTQSEAGTIKSALNDVEALLRGVEASPTELPQGSLLRA